MFGRYAIDVLQQGRSGIVRYAEGDNGYDFHWEFGGGETVATITVPTAVQWPAALPWASDRRDQILERVAKVVRKKHCPRCRVRFGDNAIDFVG